MDPEDLKADHRIVGESKLKKNWEDHGNMKPMTSENLERSWSTYSSTTKEEEYGLQANSFKVHDWPIIRKTEVEVTPSEEYKEKRRKFEEI
ncbi:hypothetical protein ANCCEY_06140 [Ancylostoma ceylanicum]|uniref:Uncharacterized protein n=1 Tax=Ancylostoma ceylanicum TaxID=53326 RepID=A0A0D6LRU9_9BILA|nr:hypothetical protein ANCCEY_06140 [Ancylostoma ceylanicum]